MKPVPMPAFDPTIFLMKYSYSDFALKPREPSHLPSTSDWRYADPGHPDPRPDPVRIVTQEKRGDWRPYEPSRDAELTARRLLREELEHQALEARIAAGLPCGRPVHRHVSARWRNYGPCARRAGHPGPCCERS